VTQLPNARPPTPHSSRVLRFLGRRQREARNATISAMPSSATLGELVDERDHEDREGDAGQLEPVEEGQAEQLRVHPVVQRHQQRRNDRQGEQPLQSVPAARQRPVDADRTLPALGEVPRRVDVPLVRIALIGITMVGIALIGIADIRPRRSLNRYGVRPPAHGVDHGNFPSMQSAINNALERDYRRLRLGLP
jgi:hypothetical protein